MSRSWQLPSRILQEVFLAALSIVTFSSLSLLNTDAKILAKVLAHRLENALPAIVSKDQTGFVKGRQSYFNIRRLLNIIHSASDDVCVVSFNAEKVLDCVEWVYLFAVLNKFGFGPNFTSWINVLYLRPTASICTWPEWCGQNFISRYLCQISRYRYDMTENQAFFRKIEILF